MRIISYNLKVPVKNGECVLIHTLTGAMFVLSRNEYQLFCNWENMEVVVPNGCQEISFLKDLYENAFVVENPEEEIALEEATLIRSKEFHDKRKVSLNGVSFVLTYLCNFACPYCYEKGIFNKKNMKMTKDMIDVIFRLNDDSIDAISLFGGEPLLPGNEDIIRYIIAKAPTASYSITTNGYYLNDYFPLLKDLNIRSIMVTLDGEEEIHNKTRILYDGSDTFKMIIKGIERYLKYNIRIRIRMNISNENIDSCLVLKEKLITNYKEMYNKGNLLFEMQPLFGLDDVKKSALEKQLYFPCLSKDNKQPMEERENSMSFVLSPLLNIFSRPRKFSPLYSHCNAESNFRLYDANGFIYSCTLAIGNENAAIGKYYPIVEMKDYSMLVRNIETIPKCRSCKLRFICGGGCANAALNIGGDVLSPYCIQIQNEIKMIPSLYEQHIKGGNK